MRQLFLPAEQPAAPAQSVARGRQLRLVAEYRFPVTRGACKPLSVRGRTVDTISLTPAPPPPAGEPEEHLFAFFREAREVFDGAELILSPPETAPVPTDFSRRGVRGLLREGALLEAFFRAAYRASALARVTLLLPFVSDPDEASALRRCAEKALRTLLYHREPFDETISIGIRLETPGSVLCGKRLLEDWDFAVADTDSLAAFTLALPRGARPTLCGGEILFRLVGQSLAAAKACGRFCGVSGFLAADGALAPRLQALGAGALFLPPEKLPGVASALAKRQ